MPKETAITRRSALKRIATGLSALFVGSSIEKTLTSSVEAQEEDNSPTYNMVTTLIENLRSFKEAASLNDRDSALKKTAISLLHILTGYIEHLPLEIYTRRTFDKNALNMAIEQAIVLRRNDYEFYLTLNFDNQTDPNVLEKIIFTQEGTLYKKSEKQNNEWVIVEEGPANIESLTVNDLSFEKIKLSIHTDEVGEFLTWIDSQFLHIESNPKATGTGIIGINFQLNDIGQTLESDH